jgi:uncharacterized damage-inducible protein DinB
MVGVELLELNDWLSTQLNNWQDWAAAQDSADWLSTPTGNERFSTIGELFRHAFSPLHRYSDQAAHSDPVDDSHVDPDKLDALLDWARVCLARHRDVIAAVSLDSGHETLIFRTRSAGELHVPSRMALAHAALHCFWHLGGIAQLLRVNGITPPQRSDLIFWAASALRS